MTEITVLIPAHNEENNIKRCLNSVLWAKKVILIFSGNDNTDKIAKNYENVEIVKVENSKNGYIDLQKNINLQIENAKTEWILRLDADEEVTQNLAQEINEIVNKETKFIAFGIARNQFFWGGFLKGGDWYYDKLIRLFKKNYAKYDPIVAIHEQFKVNGKTSVLTYKINHYSHPTLKDARNKFQKYTSLEANNLKINKLLAFIKMIYRPVYVFLRWFFYHHGYRDGIRGFVAGVYRGWYEFLIYKKYLFN